MQKTFAKREASVPAGRVSRGACSLRPAIPVRVHASVSSRFSKASRLFAAIPSAGVDTNPV